MSEKSKARQKRIKQREQKKFLQKMSNFLCFYFNWHVKVRNTLAA